MIDASPPAIYSYYAISSIIVIKDYINVEKWRLISMTFCLVCFFNCHEVCEMKLQLIVLTANGTYGSGGLANLLGRVPAGPHAHATTAASSR